MDKKTDAEIDAEVVALKALRPNLRRFNAFGDDHRAAIDAAVAVLAGRFDNDKIDRYYGEGARRESFDQHTYDEALAAMDWMNGEACEVCAPSSPDWFGGLAVKVPA